MDTGYTGKQFVGLFTPGLADQHVENLFAQEFGSLRWIPRGAGINGEFPNAITLFANCTSGEMDVVIDYECLSGAHGEDVIKELSVASEKVLNTFRFLPPTPWTPMDLTRAASHGTTELLLIHHYSRP